MKMLLLKFADQVLSKDELKRVKGGDDPYGPQGSCGQCHKNSQSAPCFNNGGGCSCFYPDGGPCSRY